MRSVLTKQPENPQGNEPGGGQPMREQTLREWALEMKERHPNAKFRLVRTGGKSQ